jgi:hypothetical protein
MALKDLTNLYVFSELQDRSFHDIPQLERLRLNIKGVACYFLHSLPVSLQHGIIGHHFKERTGLIEIVYLLLEFLEGLPLLESFGKFSAPIFVEKGVKYTVMT